jgi:hypothetical protein
MFFGMGTARHYALTGALDAVRRRAQGLQHAIARLPPPAGGACLHAIAQLALESRAAWICWSTKASSCSPATD